MSRSQSGRTHRRGPPLLCCHVLEAVSINSSGASLQAHGGAWVAVVQLVGITGHQKLPGSADSLLRQRLRDWFVGDGADIVAISSLAAGADQTFASQILKFGGK